MEARELSVNPPSIYTVVKSCRSSSSPSGSSLTLVTWCSISTPASTRGPQYAQTQYADEEQHHEYDADDSQRQAHIAQHESGDRETVTIFATAALANLAARHVARHDGHDGPDEGHREPPDDSRDEAN